MDTPKTKIVIIHDDLTEKDPLIIVLKEKYGKENVILKNKSQEGLDYVLDNLSQRIIVVLDLKFKAGEPSGVEVFENIRKSTSLIYIIVMTASDISNIDKDDLIKFINNDALAFEYSTADYTEIINLVNKAAHQLDVRIASALEQWINDHSEKEINEAYLITGSGKTYTLKQILEEIRLQSDFGMEMEKSILFLAVDMLARRKKQING